MLIQPNLDRLVCATPTSQPHSAEAHPPGINGPRGFELLVAEEVALCFVLGPGDLHVPQGSANLESRNVERGSQHARVDKSKPGTLADRTDPAVCSEPIEAGAG